LVFERKDPLMSVDGVQKIIKEIDKSTKKQVSEILSESKQKVDTVLIGAREKAAVEASAIISRGEQEARRESQRILAEARIKARREKVKAQEDVVKLAFISARESMQKMAEGKGDDYKKVLEALIKESVLSSSAESLEVLFDPRDKGLVSEDGLNKIAQEAGPDLGMTISLSVSAEELPCLGGVVVKSADGKVRIDNTFEARIDRFRDNIRTLVAKELFV
jgi:V/A-type H+-transporting ATPase subunit E